VDDVRVINNQLDAISDIKTHLHQAFQIKDLGELHYFLGFEVHRTSNGIAHSPKKYTVDLLRAHEPPERRKWNVGYVTATESSVPGTVGFA
jgi:hypothetical protein